MKKVNKHTKEMICIRCPLGCRLKVEFEGTEEKIGEIKTEKVVVTGNSCPRGDAYGRKELTNPTRILTTTVRVRGMEGKVVAVKTAEDIPKGKMLECMAILKGLEVELPVKIGDVILKDAAGTGVDIVASANSG